MNALIVEDDEVISKSLRELLQSEGYKFAFSSCSNTKAVAVIRLTDEIREELSDICVDYGQYTIFAADSLAKINLSNQNSLMKEQAELLNLDMSEECYGKLTPNQIAITYDLSSTFSATDNIVQSYLKSMNFNYKSL